MYQLKVQSEEGLTDRTLLDVKSIWDFINMADIDDIREVLSRQIEYITAQSPMKDSPEITVQILELYFLILTATTPAHAQKLALLPDLMRE